MPVILSFSLLELLTSAMPASELLKRYLSLYRRVLAVTIKETASHEKLLGATSSIPYR